MYDGDRSESTLRARAVMLIPDSIEGTDLITVEAGNDEIIITREDAEYLHWKLALILGLPCEDDALKGLAQH